MGSWEIMYNLLGLLNLHIKNSRDYSEFLMCKLSVNLMCKFLMCEFINLKNSF